MMFLGDAVWESYPSAAARVLLPMTLAFNVSVPRRRWWPLLLIVGNLGIFASADLLKPPGRESYVVEGSKDLRVNAKEGKAVEAVFGPSNWWKPEKSRWDYFRWSMGDSTVAIHNPQPFAVVADVKFEWGSRGGRTGRYRDAGWKGDLAVDPEARGGEAGDAARPGASPRRHRHPVPQQPARGIPGERGPQGGLPSWSGILR